MHHRIRHILGTATLVVGAFLVGGVFHKSFLKGTMEFTSAQAALEIAIGAVLIVAGTQLERNFDPSEHVPDVEKEEEEEFDPEMAPVSEEQLEARRERDPDSR